jgi:hypothetical protein
MLLLLLLLLVAKQSSSFATRSYMLAVIVFAAAFHQIYSSTHIDLVNNGVSDALAILPKGTSIQTSPSNYNNIDRSSKDTNTSLGGEQVQELLPKGNSPSLTNNLAMAQLYFCWTIMKRRSAIPKQLFARPFSNPIHSLPNQTDTSGIDRHQRSAQGSSKYEQARGVGWCRTFSLS